MAACRRYLSKKKQKKKQLLNDETIIELGYRKVSVNIRLRQIIDLLATEKNTIFRSTLCNNF